MRRKLQQVTDETIVQTVMQRALVCRLGMCVDNEPYVVPVSFGVSGMRLYVHGAAVGKKIDMLLANPRVCVEMELETSLAVKKKGQVVCDWGMQYASVIGMGQARILESEAEKRAGLDVIVKHYGGHPDNYSSTSMNNLAVIEVALEELSCKTSKGFQVETF